MANRYDFDDNDKGKFSGMWENMGPRVTVGAVTLAVVILAGVIWATYPDDSTTPGDAVPIVRADAGDFKTLPDDPGGMQIAHRDSTVFGAGSASEDNVENLLADDQAEEPMPKSQLFAGLNTGEVSGEIADSMPPQPDSAEATVPATNPAATADAEKTASVEEKVLNDTAPAAGGLTAPAAPTTATAPQAPKEVDMAAAAQAANQIEPTAGASTTAGTATKEATKEAAKAAKVEPAAGAASGNFYIQVGSVKEESKAAAEWKKIQAKHTGQLSTLTHRVERADLGAKGVFYRIQAGPVSKENASAACDQIKKVTPGGCLIVAD